MTHDELRAATGAYVLGALPGEEREAVDRHLRECPECAAEVAALREAAGELAYSVPNRRAPEGLRQRVLDRVAREAAEGHGGAPGAPIESPRTPAPVVVSRGLPAWMLAAAAVLLVASAGYALNLRSRVAQLETRLSQALARAAAAEQASVEARNDVTNVRQTASILVAADVSRVELAPDSVAPNAKGRAYWSASQGVIFTASGLPPAPAGRVYQVWAVTGLAPLTAVSAGLLTTDQAGDALLVNPSLSARPVAFAVTLEPAGGVPAPTGPRYLLGAL